MMSISVEAAEARDSLSDDKELVNTYEVIVLFPTYILLLGTKFAYYSVLIVGSLDFRP